MKSYLNINTSAQKTHINIVQTNSKYDSYNLTAFDPLVKLILKQTISTQSCRIRSCDVLLRTLHRPYLPIWQGQVYLTSKKQYSVTAKVNLISPFYHSSSRVNITLQRLIKNNIGTLVQPTSTHIVLCQEIKVGISPVQKSVILINQVKRRFMANTYMLSTRQSVSRGL